MHISPLCMLLGINHKVNFLDVMTRWLKSRGYTQDILGEFVLIVLLNDLGSFNKIDYNIINRFRIFEEDDLRILL
jgi:hypothetical protein